MGSDKWRPKQQRNCMSESESIHLHPDPEAFAFPFYLFTDFILTVSPASEVSASSARKRTRPDATVWPSGPVTAASQT